jgi:hypothetical protein
MLHCDFGGLCVSLKLLYPASWCLWCLVRESGLASLQVGPVCVEWEG